jgi:hypothetical protein
LAAETEENAPESISLIREHHQNLAHLELERLINLRKIKVYAEEQAEELGNETVSDEPIAPDWFSHWRNFAQDVSRDEMQQLWSKVLAGEACQPGSYSIHSMDFLARMSAQDAENLSRISPFVFNGEYIFREIRNTLEKHGIGVVDLIYLDDLGLINSAVGIGGLQKTSQTVLSERGPGYWYAVLPIGDLALIIYSKNEAKKFKIHAISVSKVGREILSLTSGQVPTEYLSEVVAHFKKDECIAAEYGVWHPDSNNAETGTVMNLVPFPDFEEL